MTKNNPLKMWQNTDNCEIEQDVTLQRAINYVKPTRPLEQNAGLTREIFRTECYCNGQVNLDNPLSLF